MKKQIHKRKSQYSGHNTAARKSRTRTLIQLGGLVEKSGIMELFDIKPGDDLQKNIDIKGSVFALMGSFIEINTLIEKGDFHPHLLAQKGAKIFNKIEKKQCKLQSDSKWN